MTDSLTVLALAAAAGGLVAASGRDAIAATPALAGWFRRAIEPLERAGQEGYAPTALERRRLAVVGALGLLGAGLVILGPGGAPILAVAGPAAGTLAVRRRRARYLREVEAGLPAIALCIADALSGGRSLRASIADAASSADGPAAVELAKVVADLDFGAPTALALRGLAGRARSHRVDSFSEALLSQRLAGGDLAGLMRTFAAASRERDRAIADARSATAQARFTGILVAAMPAGAAVFAELLEPGFLAGLLAQPASALLLGLAAALQVAGFAAIARLSRVEGV